MHKIKTISSSLAALLMAVLFTVSVPVYAQHGADDTVSTATTASSSTEVGDDSTGSSNSGSGSSTSGTSGKRVATSTTVKTEDDSSVETESATDDSGHHALRQQGAQLVAELQKEHKSTKTQAQKQKTCEAHKDGLTNKFSHIVTNSQRSQDRISGILTKAETYQTAHKVDGVDGLVTTAEAAKTTSADSIAALTEVKPTLDCNSTSVATDVATFKAAATTTRDNLKAYKSAVKAVLKALSEAKTDDSAATSTDTTNTSDGGTQ